MEEFEFSYSEMTQLLSNAQSTYEGAVKISTVGAAKEALSAVIGGLVKKVGESVAAEYTIISNLSSFVAGVDADTKRRYRDFYRTCVNGMNGGAYDRIRLKGYYTTKYFGGQPVRWITGIPTIIGYRLKGGAWELIN